VAPFAVELQKHGPARHIIPSYLCINLPFLAIRNRVQWTQSFLVGRSCSNSACAKLVIAAILHGERKIGVWLPVAML